jgi:hypothetical protein
LEFFEVLEDKITDADCDFAAEDFEVVAIKGLRGDVKGAVEESADCGACWGLEGLEVSWARVPAGKLVVSRAEVLFLLGSEELGYPV